MKSDVAPLIEYLVRRPFHCQRLPGTRRLIVQGIDKVRRRRRVYLRRVYIKRYTPVTETRLEMPARCPQPDVHFQRPRKRVGRHRHLIPVVQPSHPKSRRNVARRSCRRSAGPRIERSIIGELVRLAISDPRRVADLRSDSRLVIKTRSGKTPMGPVGCPFSRQI